MKILDIPQSGSVGAVTSSRNRSGQYRRQRANPTQPRTAAQINARARLTTASAAWRGLTVANRASWNSFANSFSTVNSLGSTIQLTGHQCFVKVQTVLSLLGVAATTTPPALPSFVTCTMTGATATAATPTLSFAGVTPTAGTIHMYYASPQLSAGVTFCGNFRYIGQNSTYTAGAFNALSLYTAKFGSLVAGKQIFIRTVQVQAGMQDNGTLFTVIIGT